MERNSVGFMTTLQRDKNTYCWLRRRQLEDFLKGVPLNDDYRYFMTLFIAISRRAPLVEGMIAYFTEETIFFKAPGDE
jgi:hypothetical protein